MSANAAEEAWFWIERGCWEHRGQGGVAFQWGEAIEPCPHCTYAVVPSALCPGFPGLSETCNEERAAHQALLKVREAFDRGRPGLFCHLDVLRNAEPLVRAALKALGLLLLIVPYALLAVLP